MTGLNQQDLQLISDPNGTPSSAAVNAAAAAVVAAAAAASTATNERAESTSTSPTPTDLERQSIIPTDFYGHNYENQEPMDTSLEWGSLEAARNYVYEYGFRNGFVALTTSTTRDKRHCVISCNKRGSCKSRSKGLRNRRSFKCGCKWHVNIWIRSQKTEATRYKITSSFLKHNHPPMAAEDMEKIARKRRNVVAAAAAAAEVAAIAPPPRRASEFPSPDLPSPSSPLSTTATTSSMDRIRQCVTEILRLSTIGDGPVLDDMALQLQLFVRNMDNAIQLRRATPRKRRQPTTKKNNPIKRPRRCRRCNEEGHDVRVCPEPELK